ncbi:hypothetical protein ASD11_17180 [Aeromicrobium sp. Root495]|uniref:DUF6629 family protein n=1 Tax=Aeromicrobium sp. Root495 TaxID=1736550 RepID=UPI0006F738A5|nr:DUF6629 family protein [Aeromicrobium sp. Root495]KQY55285.1 hypothetical protein ASD11_17180 [Aeromicrobium sp. Root495]
MCFSPEADVVGGLVISAAGIDALRHAGPRPARLALGALPLLLGLHQLTEAVVWWGLRGDLPAGWTGPATWAYLLVAFVVLPPYVPLVVRALEPRGLRRHVMTVFAVVGTAVSALLLAALLRGPVKAALGDHHIAYSTGLPAEIPVTAAYVAATCGSALFSRHRAIAVFGAVNLVAVAVIAYLTIDGFASIWCAWAAVASLLVAVYLRRTDRRARTVPV